MYKMFADIGITTEYEKGQPARFNFGKSGAYSEKDRDFWKPFYARKEWVLRPGTYIITAALDGDLLTEERERTGSGVILRISRTITVKGMGSSGK